MSTKPFTFADLQTAVTRLEVSNMGTLRYQATKTSIALSQIWVRATDAWIAAWILRFGTTPTLCTTHDLTARLEPSAEPLPDISGHQLRDAAAKLPADVAAHPDRFKLTVATKGTAEGGLQIGVAWEPLNTGH